MDMWVYFIFSCFFWSNDENGKSRCKVAQSSSILNKWQTAIAFSRNASLMLKVGAKILEIKSLYK